jgi:cytochrome c oxidase subunit 2
VPGRALFVLLAVLTLLGSAVFAARKDAGSGGAHSFDVKVSRYQFEPSVLEVTEGDRVVVTLRSADTTHGFAIKELQVKSRVPKGGEPVTVEFIASQPGTFNFVCSEYCGKGHREMKGQLVVAPRSAR